MNAREALEIWFEQQNDLAKRFLEFKKEFSRYYGIKGNEKLNDTEEKHLLDAKKQIETLNKTLRELKVFSFENA